MTNSDQFKQLREIRKLTKHQTTMDHSINWESRYQTQRETLYRLYEIDYSNLDTLAHELIHLMQEGRVTNIKEFALLKGLIKRTTPIKLPDNQNKEKRFVY